MILPTEYTGFYLLVWSTTSVTIESSADDAAIKAIVRYMPPDQHGSFAHPGKAHVTVLDPDRSPYPATGGHHRCRLQRSGSGAATAQGRSGDRIGRPAQSSSVPAHAVSGGHGTAQSG